MNKKIEPFVKNKAHHCNDVVCSDILLAAKAGWRLIVGLVLFGIGLSFVYDNRRPSLYEAKATIRVGWVPLGSSTLSIEPIKDLVAMAKDDHLLIPLFKELGFSENDGRASQLRNGLSLSAKSPNASLVEFKLVLENKANAEAWLSKLLQMKLAEHSKIIDDYIVNYGDKSDCIRSYDLSRKVGEREFYVASSYRGEFPSCYLSAPLVERTIVSDSVKVGVARVFPSLQFLISSSIIAGVVVGVLISFIFSNMRGFLRVD